jgi:segregation and condensation protein B
MEPVDYSDNNVSPDLVKLVEAIMFLENRPVKIGYIARIAHEETDQVLLALDELERIFAERDSALQVVRREGEASLSVRSELYRNLGPQYDYRKKVKLSKQALETLAIIAYRQPITRVEIEKLRGVRVGHLIRSLLELNLIRITGRKDVVGKPVTYGTTDKFLKFFSLLSLEDLPTLSDLEEG